MYFNVECKDIIFDKAAYYNQNNFEQCLGLQKRTLSAYKSCFWMLTIILEMFSTSSWYFTVFHEIV